MASFEESNLDLAEVLCFSSQDKIMDEPGETNNFTLNFLCNLALLKGFRNLSFQKVLILNLWAPKMLLIFTRLSEKYRHTHALIYVHAEYPFAPPMNLFILVQTLKQHRQL